MFETLSGKLQNVFQELTRRGKLSEADVDVALREIRVALLEADVHFKVVKDFLGRVRTRAIGREVSRALNPGQQVIKIVNDELIATLGEPEALQLSGQPPRVVMLVGLQGAGKTTMAAKLARQLRSSAGFKPLLVAADPYRPAAIDQLQTLGAQIDVPVFTGAEAPPELAANAVKHAASVGHTLVILDTAGRLQIDDDMMAEVAAIRERTGPDEVLLVADAMVGQESVRIAEGFHSRIGLTGLVLTKVDGDARGGAAISMRAVTGVPIKYLGTGEKIGDLERFSPERLSSRILGMGDVLGLIEKAEAAYEETEARELERKFRKAEFDLEDFLEQMRKVHEMGPVGQLLDMVPGMGRMTAQVDPQQMDKQFRQMEAIISSMTPHERRNPRVMNASRKRRVAAGSGTEVQMVNRLLRQFRDMQKMMKQMTKRGKGRRGMPMFPGM
ncbi:MAG: signal recognition particle protein, partial [Methyloligellaceae bacterium]